MTMDDNVLILSHLNQVHSLLKIVKLFPQTTPLDLEKDDVHVPVKNDEVEDVNDDNYDKDEDNVEEFSLEMLL